MSRSKKIVTGIADQLPLAIKTGTYTCGYKQAIRNLVTNNAKVIVLTKNYPTTKRRLIEYYASLADNTPVLSYDGNNNELAKLIEKFHRVGVIAITNQGEADLIKVTDN